MVWRSRISAAVWSAARCYLLRRSENGSARSRVAFSTARDLKTFRLKRTAVTPTFDWRQLRRWSVAESALPAGSVVRFREFSVWERYRTAIIVTASVLLLQSVLIASLVFERRRRRLGRD